MTESIDASLAQLQRQFIAHLRGTPDEALRQALDVGRLPASTGLRIYTHAYGARLREALENDHPVLATYLGDDLWDALCRGYIDAHPSRVRSLRNFGDALPEYLAGAAEFSGHPQLAELATFERLLLDSFDAADDPRADWAQLQAIPADAWPALRMRMHRSVRVHRACHGSVGIWQAIKADKPPPEHAGIEEAVDWLLWRDADGVGRFRSLEPDSAAAFDCCLHGGTFAELCERLAMTHPVEEVPALAYRRIAGTGVPTAGSRLGSRREPDHGMGVVATCGAARALRMSGVRAPASPVSGVMRGRAEQGGQAGQVRLVDDGRGAALGTSSGCPVNSMSGTSGNRSWIVASASTPQNPGQGEVADRNGRHEVPQRLQQRRAGPRASQFEIHVAPSSSKRIRSASSLESSISRRRSMWLRLRPGFR